MPTRFVSFSCLLWRACSINYDKSELTLTSYYPVTKHSSQALSFVDVWNHCACHSTALDMPRVVVKQRWKKKETPAKKLLLFQLKIFQLWCPCCPRFNFDPSVSNIHADPHIDGHKVRGTCLTQCSLFLVESKRLPVSKSAAPQPENLPIIPTPPTYAE
jgi:hypothetical protein